MGIGPRNQLEHPELACVQVDLDPAADGDGVKVLLEEILAPDGKMSGVSGRPAPCGPTGTKPFTNTDGWGAASTSWRAAYRLAISKRGILENLVLNQSRRCAPGPGEVEIRVQATGVNFRDVLNALGLYPGDPGLLGLECAGEIVAMGEGIDGFKLGEAVVALAPGSFSSFVTTSAAYVVHKPESLSFEEAATIPVTFLTAYYGLGNIGEDVSRRAGVDPCSGWWGGDGGRAVGTSVWC